VLTIGKKKEGLVRSSACDERGEETLTGQEAKRWGKEKIEVTTSSKTEEGGEKKTAGKALCRSAKSRIP